MPYQLSIQGSSQAATLDLVFTTCKKGIGNTNWPAARLFYSVGLIKGNPAANCNEGTQHLLPPEGSSSLSSSQKSCMPGQASHI